MKTSIEVIINLALFSALAVAGSKIEATDGQNVTIYFNIDEVEKADLVRISFKGDNEEKRLIAQIPWRSNIPPPSGVSMDIEKGRVSLTIQKVNNSSSGLYEALALAGFGETVSVVKVQLIVNRENKASFSSTIAPPHSSTPKPLTSDLLWLWALIPLVIVILGGVCFCKYRKVLCFGNLEPGEVKVVMDGCKENGKALLQQIV